MPLQSKTLKGNERLESILSGHGYIQRYVPNDTDAIQRVQVALRDLTGAQMPNTFTAGPNKPDGIYGKESDGACKTFQQQAFPGKPQEVDGVVGPKTLKALDEQLVRSGKDHGPPGERPSIPVQPRPGPPIQPVPTPTPTPRVPEDGCFVTNQPAGELQIDSMKHNAGKQDLDSRVRQIQGVSTIARARVWFAKLGVGADTLDQVSDYITELNFLASLPWDQAFVRLVRIFANEAAALTDLTQAALTNFPDVDLSTPMSARAVQVNQALMENELQLGGGQPALDLFSRFKGYTTVPASYNGVAIPSLDTFVAQTTGFQTAARQFETRLEDSVKDQFAMKEIHYLDLRTGSAPNRTTWSIPNREQGHGTGRDVLSTEIMIPRFSRTELGAKVIFGSLQGGDVYMSNFQASPRNRTYSCKLRYQFFDHFGVDDTDCMVSTSGHGSPGQVAMWVLQHFSRGGNKPLVTRMNVQKIVHGRF